MSNGLFIQSYPAPGVEIVPASYTVGKAGYAFIASITVLIILMVGHGILEKSRWLPFGLVIYFLIVSLALIFFRSFKLDVRTDGISYSNSFRGERFLAWPEISTVVLFTNRWTGNREQRLSLSFTMLGTIVITPKPETGKLPLKIPLWLFSDPAESQVTHLLRPEEWDTDS